MEQEKGKEINRKNSGRVTNRGKKTGVQVNDDPIDPAHLRGIEAREDWTALDEVPLIEGRSDEDEQ